MSAGLSRKAEPLAARPRHDIGFALADWAAEVFRAPLDFIVAEHGRQAAVCDVMERLVHNPRHGVEQATIEAVRSYLVRDFPLHIADEEEDLFPLLQRRCPPEDTIGEIIDLLRREHETDIGLQPAVIEDLALLIGGRALNDPARAFMNLATFAETQRRHLAWENAVVVPRARSYLTADDQRELGRRMARRRGIELGD